MQKPILLGNRCLGHIDTEKNIFITHREKDIHLFRNFEGLGFNKNLIEKLNGKIKEIWVFYHMERETILLKTTTKIVITQGIEWRNTSDLKDVQLILPLNDFERI